MADKYDCKAPIKLPISIHLRKQLEALRRDQEIELDGSLHRLNGPRQDESTTFFGLIKIVICSYGLNDNELFRKAAAEVVYSISTDYSIATASGVNGSRQVPPEVWTYLAEARSCARADALWYHLDYDNKSVFAEGDGLRELRLVVQSGLGHMSWREQDKHFDMGDARPRQLLNIWHKTGISVRQLDAAMRENLRHYISAWEKSPTRLAPESAEHKRLWRLYESLVSSERAACSTLCLPCLKHEDYGATLPHDWRRCPPNCKGPS